MKEDNFIEENIDIDFSFFKKISLKDIASWEHLELMLTLRGKEIDRKFFNFILAGAFSSQKMIPIVLEALNSDELNEIANDVSVVETIMKLDFSNNFEINKLKNEWYKLDDEENFLNYGRSMSEQIKYKFFNLLDSKFPLLMLKFYDKHKMFLHKNDEKFVVWLFRQTKIKASKSKMFVEILKTLEKDFLNQRTLNMHLN